MDARGALRDAIDDLEWIVTTAESASPRRTAATHVLARLYATYAQAMLDEHGVEVDLPRICGDGIQSMALPATPPPPPPSALAHASGMKDRA